MDHKAAGSEVSQDTVNRVIDELYTHRLIKFGNFTLKSGGPLSPFYIDLRGVQSHVSAYDATVQAYVEMLKDASPHAFLAGVPEAGTPLASMVGYELARPLVQPRKVKKSHGTKRSVEGDYYLGDKVILIDDLITHGDSKLEVIAQVEAAGLEIEKFLVLIDREQGGIEMIQKLGYDIQAAISISSLANRLHSRNDITDEQHDTIISSVVQVGEKDDSSASHQ